MNNYITFNLFIFKILLISADESNVLLIFEFLEELIFQRRALNCLILLSVTFLILNLFFYFNYTNCVILNHLTSEWTTAFSKSTSKISFYDSQQYILVHFAIFYRRNLHLDGITSPEIKLVKVRSLKNCNGNSELLPNIFHNQHEFPRNCNGGQCASVPETSMGN